MKSPQMSLLATIAVLFCTAACIAPATAQVPDTLKYAIAPPDTGLQSGGLLGYRMAANSAYIVAGAPYDDSEGGNSGVVKIFSATTGTRLHVLVNPSPGGDDHFGNAVAISGTRVVVGAPNDNTGASDAGRAYVYDLASATPTVPVVILGKAAPATSDFFGYAVAIDGNRVIIGAYGDDTGAIDSGIAYVYDLGSAAPATPVFTLINPSPANSDHFGIAAAISGARVIIGCNMDDTGAVNAGSAYVYDLGGATPTIPVFTLNNPAPGVSDNFGISVAIDGTRAVVGASLDDAGATDTGSAYVYDLAFVAPTVPIATLNNPTPEANDSFGVSVAIAGTRVAVGAYSDDTGAPDTGSVYLYDLTGPTPWLPVTTLHDPNLVAQDHFGISVAFFDTHLAVGAYGDDTGAVDAGSVYVYDLGGTTPTVPVAKLNDPGPKPNEFFGSAVAVSGRWLAVAAYGDDTGAVDAGTVYVYDLTGPTPGTPILTLHNPEPQDGDFFGNALAMSGSRLVVGNNSDDINGAADAGSVFVYDIASASPTVPVVTLHNPHPSENDNFGYAVAISGTRIVVGAIFARTGIFQTGAAFVYDLASPTPDVPAVTLTKPDLQASDDFGSAVAIDGPFVVVGSSFAKSGGVSGAGKALVYDLTSATPATPVLTLENPNPIFSSEFGNSVAISGTRAVVSAYGDNTGGANAGAAYVYDLAGATPAVPIVTLIDPATTAGDLFGYSVATSGNRLMVSAYGDDTGATNSGRAYLFDLASATPSVPVITFNNPSPGAGDNFGRVLAIEGTTVAFGLTADDTVASNKGYAYVFRPANDDFDGDGLLDLWEEAHFGSTAAHTALDDGDDDGRSELLEEAFDTDPLIPDASLAPVLTNEGGYLTMTVAKRAGVTYEIQSAATPDEAAFSAASTTVLLDNAATLKVRDNFLIGTTPGRYMRVKVTAAP